MTWWPLSSRSWPSAPPYPWDDGVIWFTQMVTPPSTLVLSLPYIVDSVLRSPTDHAEDEHITALIQQATAAAEDDTQRAVAPQTLAMVLDKFPAGRIVIARPPLIAIDSLEYYDADGELQTLTGSPAEYRLVPSGRVSKAEIWPLSGASWPSTEERPDAVTITYQAGYEAADDPIFQQIKAGICVHIAEAYKQRSLSGVGADTKAQLRLDHFWRRVY